MIVLQKKANTLLESYVREIYSDELYTLIHKLNKNLTSETLENDLRKVADKVIISDFDIDKNHGQGPMLLWNSNKDELFLGVVELTRDGKVILDEKNRKVDLKTNIKKILLFRIKVIEICKKESLRTFFSVNNNSQTLKKNIQTFLNIILIFIALLALSTVLELLKKFVIDFNQTNYLAIAILLIFALLSIVSILSIKICVKYKNIVSDGFYGIVISSLCISIFSIYSIAIIDYKTVLMVVLVGTFLLIKEIFSSVGRIYEDKKKSGKMLKAILFSVITSIFLFINSVLIIKGITTYSAVLTFIVFQMAILNIFFIVKSLIHLYKMYRIQSISPALTNMQPQLVSNYKRILDLNYVKVTGNNSSFKSINAKFIYNYLVNQTSGVYLSNDLNTEKYNFVINKGLKGEDIFFDKDIKDFVEKVGVSINDLDFKKTIFNQNISTSEKKLLILAISIMENTDYIILDQFLDDLDEKIFLSCLSLLKQYYSTVIVFTYRKEEVDGYYEISIDDGDFYRRSEE